MSRNRSSVRPRKDGKLKAFMRNKPLNRVLLSLGIAFEDTDAFLENANKIETLVRPSDISYFNRGVKLHSRIQI